MNEKLTKVVCTQWCYKEASSTMWKFLNSQSGISIRHKRLIIDQETKIKLCDFSGTYKIHNTLTHFNNFFYIKNNFEIDLVY